MNLLRKYYLAYGMNTNLSSMHQRCPNAISLGKVTLPDHELQFKQFCDVVPKKGSDVDCVLWSITEQCEKSLDRLEGYPDFYTKKNVQVWHQGKLIWAMIYVMTDYYEQNLPSEYYFFTVLEGYRSHNIDENQLHQALNRVDHILTP